MADSDRKDATSALTTALARLLAPIVRVLLRYGISYGAFAELAKHVYVRVAAEHFRIAARKQSTSRIALLTGLPRKEVARLLHEPAAADAVSGEEHSRLARLISGWRHDRRFLDARRKPAALPFEGGDRSFAELVRRYGSDVPARATLDELLRLEAVERLKDGRIRLIVESAVPIAAEIDKVEVLGADVADLVSAIDHNLLCKRGDEFLQRKVAYDNLPRDAADKLRTVIRSDAERLIEKVDAAFAKHDRDLTATVKGSGRRRVVLGIWYYEDDFADEPVRDEKLPPGRS
jgi:hypothetical protein